jgi:hypothetical protein
MTFKFLFVYILGLWYFLLMHIGNCTLKRGRTSEHRAGTAVGRTLTTPCLGQGSATPATSFDNHISRRAVVLQAKWCRTKEYGSLYKQNALLPYFWNQSMVNVRLLRKFFEHKSRKYSIPSLKLTIVKGCLFIWFMTLKIAPSHPIGVTDSCLHEVYADFSGGFSGSTSRKTNTGQQLWRCGTQ